MEAIAAATAAAPTTMTTISLSPSHTPTPSTAMFCDVGMLSEGLSWDGVAE